jgi:hypothetical protein
MAVLSSMEKIDVSGLKRAHNLTMPGIYPQVCTWLTTLVETDSLSSRLYQKICTTQSDVRTMCYEFCMLTATVRRSPLKVACDYLNKRHAN